MAVEPTQPFAQLAPWPWSLQCRLSNWHHDRGTYTALCPTDTMSMETTEPFFQLAPWSWSLQSLLSKWHHGREAYKAFSPNGTMALEPTERFVQFEPWLFPRSFKRHLNSAESTKTCYIIKDRENCIFFYFKKFNPLGISCTTSSTCTYSLDGIELVSTPGEMP